ncbi:MAG: TIGR04211 family SH3 domain-containing protein [Gammaproteobacteria bacterium]|nr:TIGR04211 family SH3 domain-containing protein [Gammaproteobacteria bacterium]
MKYGHCSKTFHWTSPAHRVVWLLCLLMMLPISAQAQTVYVSDNLRVGVRDSAGDDANTLTIISSGSQVEILERRGSFSKVRTSNGIEGWVRSVYFESDKPARVLLSETKAKLRQLENELNQLKATKAPGAQPSEQSNDEINQLKAHEEELLQQLKEAQQANADGASGGIPADASLRDLFASSNSKLLLTSVGTLMVFLCMGFLIGVSWHKRQVTKRLGGLSL